MPEIHASKTLEVKIKNKTVQERADQKDVSRVFFSKDALLDLRLEAGKLCYLQKIEDLQLPRRQVMAWPAPAALNKGSAQMSKTLREACGFMPEDRVAAVPCGDISTTECVVLRDITTIPALSESDRPHYEWKLGKDLGKQSRYSS
jgi:hypothetical protein